jgi:small subunit ribosomal protein S17
MKKIFKGEVVSVKQKNTAVVRIVRKVQHPLYKKLLTVSKKFNVDTTGFTPAVGEMVKIEETRPLSKTKNFKIVEVVK